MITDRQDDATDEGYGLGVGSRVPAHCKVCVCRGRCWDVAGCRGGHTNGCGAHKRVAEAVRRSVAVRMPHIGGREGMEKTDRKKAYKE